MPQLHDVTLDLEELSAACLLVGADEVPVVLDAPIVPAAGPGAERARRDRLDGRGLVVDGELHPELAEWLRALALPRAEVAVRYLRGGVTHRLAVAWPQDRPGVVLAVRHGDSVTLRASEHGWDQAVRTFLGQVPELRFRDVHAPEPVMLAVLQRHHHPQAMAAAAQRLGAGPEDATLLAEAFTRVFAIAEVTASRRAAAGPGAVAVYDTAWGRIVCTPAIAPDGARWLTLSPGTPHRLGTALAALSPSHRSPDRFADRLAQWTAPR